MLITPKWRYILKNKSNLSFPVIFDHFRKMTQKMLYFAHRKWPWDISHTPSAHKGLIPLESLENLQQMWGWAKVYGGWSLAMPVGWKCMPKYGLKGIIPSFKGTSLIQFYVGVEDFVFSVAQMQCSISKSWIICNCILWYQNRYV